MAVIRDVGVLVCLMALGGCQDPKTACAMAGRDALSILGPLPVVEPGSPVAGMDDGCTWRFTTKEGPGSLALSINRMPNAGDFFDLHRRELETDARQARNVEGLGDDALRYRQDQAQRIDWIDGSSVYMLVGTGVLQETTEDFARKLEP